MSVQNNLDVHRFGFVSDVRCSNYAFLIICRWQSNPTFQLYQIIVAESIIFCAQVAYDTGKKSFIRVLMIMQLASFQLTDFELLLSVLKWKLTLYVFHCSISDASVNDLSSRCKVFTVLFNWLASQLGRPSAIREQLRSYF